jgi:hypothetical protein
LSVPAKIAYAFKVLAVDVDFIEGMVAEVRQRFRSATDGP